MHGQRIPFSSESTESLRNRFVDAISNPIEFDDLVSGKVPRAGQRPECVFDFEDGRRLIVSRDVARSRLLDIVHVSHSLYSDLVPRADARKLKRAGENAGFQDAHEHLAMILPLGFEVPEPLECRRTAMVAHVMYHGTDFVEILP